METRTKTPVQWSLLQACERLCRNDPRLTDLSATEVDNDDAKALSLFLQNNTRLKNLDLRFDDITGMVGIKALFKTLKKNRSIESFLLLLPSVKGKSALEPELRDLITSNVSRLTKLHLNIGFEVKDVAAIVDCLKHRNNTIKCFVLVDGGKCGNNVARALSESSPGEIELKCLRLIANDIDKWGASLLADWLRGNTSLDELGLEDNEIEGDGAESIGKMLSENKTLRALELGGNPLGDIGANVLGEGLFHNGSLTKLSLIDTGINYPGVLARAIGTNNGLKALVLRLNLLGDDFLGTLAAALRTNHSLLEVDLSANKIGDKGVRALGDALRCNTSIRSINLSCNSFGVDGLQGLCTVLQSENDSVEELFLDCIGFGSDGASPLAEMITHNSHIEKLSLEYNHISDRGAKVLSEALTSAKHSVTFLSLNGNCIGSSGFSYIADMLAQESSLQKLYLGSPLVEDDRVIKLCEGLKSNKSLKVLYLDGWETQLEKKLSEKGLLAIKNGIENHPYLETIGYEADSSNRAQELDAEIRFRCDWNENGRYLLSEENVPTSLWADVMAKASGCFEASVIFSFLREKTELCNPCTSNLGNDGNGRGEKRRRRGD